MADFSTEAELSLTVPTRELRSAKQQIEDGIGDVSVSLSDGPAARNTGSQGRDSRRMMRWARQRTEDISDILTILENIDDNIGDGGGDGGAIRPRRTGDGSGLAGLIGGALGTIALLGAASEVGDETPTAEPPPVPLRGPRPTPGETPTPTPDRGPYTIPSGGRPRRGDTPTPMPTDTGMTIKDRLETAMAVPVAMTGAAIEAATPASTEQAGAIATGATAAGGLAALLGPAGLAGAAGLSGLIGGAGAQQGGGVQVDNTTTYNVTTEPDPKQIKKDVERERQRDLDKLERKIERAMDAGLTR